MHTKKNFPRLMQLANIKVTKKKPSSWSDKPANKGTSLKNLQQVRTQIAKQEKIKRKSAGLAGDEKVSHKAQMLKQEIQKAFERLRGVKVHDNLTILKKAEKRLVKKKAKSAITWEKRKEEVKQSQETRQQKRKDNIAMHRGSKKNAPAPVTPEGVAVSTPNTKMSRKQRRHQNLMKFGPKKTRSDREDSKKDARKERRKTDRKSDRKAIKKTDKPKGKGRK